LLEISGRGWCFLEFGPASSGRMIVALVLIGLIAASAFRTMQPGKFRDLCFILLAFFALRVVLGRARSR
jgi:hypothetical protein